MGRKKANSNGNGANLGFEEKLWQAADKMRGHMDPADDLKLVIARDMWLTGFDAHCQQWSKRVLAGTSVVLMQPTNSPPSAMKKRLPDE